MQELRRALRTLRATPVVSAAAILSLAIGIGANTAIFSLVEALLLRPLPVAAPDRLVALGTAGPNSGATGQNLDWTSPQWDAIRRHADLFGSLFAYASARFDLAAGGRTDFVNGAWVSGGYFDTLGVRAEIGRVLSDADDRPDAPSGPVAVISHAIWQRRFGGASDIVGRTLSIERVSYTVVGVAPAAFHGVDVGIAADLFVPLGTEPLVHGTASLQSPRYWWLSIVARLAPRQTIASAAVQLQAIRTEVQAATLPLPGASSDDRRETFVVSPAALGQSSLRDRYGDPLLTLLAIVFVVLLIASGNVANLQLARSSARRHDVSVRAALGASRLHLAAPLLAESAWLAASGVALGVLAAHWGARLLVAQISTAARPVFLDTSVSMPVLAFTAAVGAGSALIFGVAPALRAMDADPIDALREQGRGGRGIGGFTTTNGLVVAQVALSLALSAGAALFIGSFVRLTSHGLGFERSRILLAELNPGNRTVGPEPRLRLFGRIVDAARTQPGVADAAVSLFTPIGNSLMNTVLHVPGGAQLSEPEMVALSNDVSPGWFSTYGTPVLAGRDFTAADTAQSLSVAIVNEAFARRFLGGANPIGRMVAGPGDSAGPEIVGVVGDAAYASVRGTVPPTVYWPLAQTSSHWEPASNVTLAVRTAAGSPAALTRGIARAIGRVSPDVSITFRTMDDQVNGALTQDRLLARLSGAFGALALILAAIGLYGVTSYTVALRRSEIAVRIALGAPPARIVRHVLGRVGVLLACGVAAGTVLSWWAAGFVSANLLFGVAPRDASALAAAALALTLVGLAAGWLPARRAARIDPADVLRDA